MAKREVRIPVEIWSDPFFVALSPRDQWLFFALLSQPELDAAGLIILRPRRWSNQASDLNVDQVRESLGSLVAADRLVVDDETEEVYIPAFFEFEHIGRQPRRAIAAVDALGACHSERLRALVMADLMALASATPPATPRGVRAEMLLRDGNQCRRCGWKPGDPVPAKNGRLLYRGLELDHVHPKSKSGPDHPDNLQVLCTSCNASKGARV
ncbi:HNH endonuclease [Streptosporangium sp. NPDC004631]